MKIQVKVKGIKKAMDSLKSLEKDLEAPFRDVILGGAQLIRSEAVKSIMQGPKTGRIYEKYNPRRTHRASAPGQAPASDTGNLVSQIQVKSTNPDEVTVESGANYSKFLEFGTSKILPRPFLFPATERSRPKIQQAVFNKVVQTIKRLIK
jgi:HK97 gp10 family phage protein